MSTVQPQPHIGLSTPPPMHWQQPRFVARSTAKRVAMFAGMVAAMIAVMAVILGLFTARISPADYATPAEYEQATVIGTAVAYAVYLPLLLGLFAALAPKVSYRRRDAFFIFVPIWSWVFQVRVLWRVTALPDRDWPQRPDEYDGGVAVPQQQPYFDLFNR